ncbi:hypothetical protein ACFQPC_02080 [Herminiimonas glaciei]|uniref:Uncharacterized protein n=1 Tax=Herminiimonas glaciei TaxID=523788 RepID=A0ABW2I702_9BURK
MLGSSWQDGWTAWQALSVVIHIGRNKYGGKFPDRLCLPRRKPTPKAIQKFTENYVPPRAAIALAWLAEKQIFFMTIR